jgi:HEAT repeat protein
MLIGILTGQAENPEARRDAAAVLGHCLPKDEQEITKAMREVLKPGNPASVRREAAVRLISATMEQDDEASKVLRQLLQDKHLPPEVRAETARALATVGTQIKWARPLLIEALSDDSALMRQSAAQALGSVGGTEAVTALSAQMEDKDALVRINAAVALLANGAKNDKVLEALEAGLKSTESGVLNHVLQALARVIVPRELDRAVQELVLDPSPEVRRSAVLLLVRRT